MSKTLRKKVVAVEQEEVSVPSSAPKVQPLTGVTSTDAKVEPVVTPEVDKTIKSEATQPTTGASFTASVGPISADRVEMPGSDSFAGVQVIDSVAGTSQPVKKVEKGSGVAKNILLFVIGLAVGGGVFGGIIYYKLKMDKINCSKVPEATVAPIMTVAPTASPSVGPSASPSAQLKLADYKLKVFNGSGISGKASEVKAILVKAGFTSVDTGNAESANYKGIEVSTKKTVPDGVFEAISKALEKTYKVTKVTKMVEDKASYDVLVTVGSAKE